MKKRPALRFLPPKTLLAILVGCAANHALAEDSAPWITPEYLAQPGLQQINAAAAYAAGYSGEGVKAGVVDSGVAATHSEFSGRISGGYDIGLEIPTTQENGLDHEGHGSHVGSIIAANRDGIGMHGVAFGAQLFAVGIDSDENDEDGSFAAGWNQMAPQKDLAVINNSIGMNDCEPGAPPPCNISHYTPENVSALYPKTLASLEKIRANDTLLVFATGNEAQPHPDLLAGMPLLFQQFASNWLAVTAVDGDNSITDYANRCGAAALWCLAAPGGGDDQENDGIYAVNKDGGYVRMSGTSMAAPHVTGAAALVKQAFPFFSAANLQQTLLTTATPLGDPTIYGWGLLNVGKAVHGPGQFTADFSVDTQGYAATFSNDISGSGGLTKRGAGSITLSGNSTYGGPTEVSAGALIVNGSIASSVRVGSAGELAGSGSVGSVDNQGRLGSGAAGGSLHIAGDYLAHPASVHELAFSSPEGPGSVLQIAG